MSKWFWFMVVAAAVGFIALQVVTLKVEDLRLKIVFYFAIALVIGIFAAIMIAKRK